MIKLGIDRGGGFLKFCLSFNKMNNSSCSSAVFKDSEVKKIIIIGIGPEMEYFKIGYYSLFKKYGSVRTISTDLKLVHILCGLMAHSSYHPFTWCNTTKNSLNQSGELYYKRI